MPKRSKSSRCRWCGKKLSSKGHRRTEEQCFAYNETEIRSRFRPRVKRIEEVYSEGRMRPAFVGTDMESKLLKRQQRLATDAALFDVGDYRAPRNVSHMSEQGFVWVQIATATPFAVVVLGKVRPNGTRKRMTVTRNNLWDAVHAHRLLSKKYRHVYIFSRNRAYDLPPQWRFKKTGLSRKFVWCPYCADFRLYHKVDPLQKISAMKKVEVYNDKKREYEFTWKEIKLWLTACIICGNTNRDSVYRRANQPWELRHINPKRRRVKPRRGLPKQYTQKKMRGRKKR